MRTVSSGSVVGMTTNDETFRQLGDECCALRKEMECHRAFARLATLERDAARAEADRLLLAWAKADTNIEILTRAAAIERDELRAELAARTADVTSHSKIAGEFAEQAHQAKVDLSHARANEHLQQQAVALLRSELEKADSEIAALKARTVKLPFPLNGVITGFTCRDIVQMCADAIRAAGVKVEAGGWR
jgi:hypothetical protein